MKKENATKRENDKPMKKSMKKEKAVTKRRKNNFELYLDDISKLEVLSKEESNALSARIKQGDEEALAKLIEGNLRLVVTQAKKFAYLSDGYVNVMDAIGNGNVGLVKAAKSYNASLGYAFSTYAVRVIKSFIARGYNESINFLHVPSNVLETRAQVKKLISRFEEKHGRKPSESIIVELTGKSEKNVADAMNYKPSVVSLDVPTGIDEKGNVLTLGDVLEYKLKEDINNPYQQMELETMPERMEQYFRVLTPGRRRL